MQKWEYLKETNATTDTLSQLGRQGWELVAIASNTEGDSNGISTNNTWVFKRPLAK